MRPAIVQHRAGSVLPSQNTVGTRFGGRNGHDPDPPVTAGRDGRALVHGLAVRIGPRRRAPHANAPAEGFASDIVPLDRNFGDVLMYLPEPDSPGPVGLSARRGLTPGTSACRRRPALRRRGTQLLRRWRARQRRMATLYALTSGATRYRRLLRAPGLINPTAHSSAISAYLGICYVAGQDTMATRRRAAAGGHRHGPVAPGGGPLRPTSAAPSGLGAVAGVGGWSVMGRRPWTRRHQAAGSPSSPQTMPWPAKLRRSREHDGCGGRPFGNRILPSAPKRRASTHRRPPWTAPWCFGPGWAVWIWWQTTARTVIDWCFSARDHVAKRRGLLKGTPECAKRSSFCDSRLWRR